MTDYTDHPCDLCGADDAAEIEIARQYMDGQQLHVCRNCGFVHVRRRRSAQEIADDWSEDLYARKYTARIPAVRARQAYVAEFLDTRIGTRGRSVCDIGAGEGTFLDMLRAAPYDADVFGIEPSAANGRLMDEMGIPNFVGTIEGYAADPAHRSGFDVATIVWTLENCQSCRAMLDAAHDLLADGGHVVVATGSRILVPFKKPLHYYLGTNAADTHAFRFSANALRGALAESGFETVEMNRYIDTDYLVAIGRKTDRSRRIEWAGDDWRDVLAFFERWHEDTKAHFKDA